MTTLHRVSVADLFNHTRAGQASQWKPSILVVQYGYLLGEEGAPTDFYLQPKQGWPKTASRARRGLMTPGEAEGEDRRADVGEQAGRDAGRGAFVDSSSFSFPSLPFPSPRSRGNDRSPGLRRRLPPPPHLQRTTWTRAPLLRSAPPYKRLASSCLVYIYRRPLRAGSSTDQPSQQVAEPPEAARATARRTQL